MTAAAIDEGRLLRSIRKGGKRIGNGLSDWAVWDVVQRSAKEIGIERFGAHDLRRTCAKLCRKAGGDLEQIQFLLGHSSIQTTERYLGAEQEIELARLETRFTKFNVFEALGVARRELHHSSFLAFLLDPSESHGLRELFLRRFLQETVRSAPHPVISAIELDAIDLKDIEIRREYENIDIFLRDRKNRILVIVENKVGSKQHDDQLERYYVDMTERHPGHRFLGVYLTASGETSENDNYVSASYGMVRRLVDELLTRESVLMPPNVRSVLEQYVDLLGRRFMADQELRELCESIYRQHRQAIDILHDNRPDPFSRVFTIVEGLVKESGFTPAESDNVAMRFIPQEFTIPLFKSDTAWLDERQMVYAECKKKAQTLVFQVKMDGGSMEERSLAHQFALTHKPFRPERTLYTKYQVLYTRTLLENVDVEAPDKVLKQRLTEEWEKVLTNELAEMRNACAGAASNDTSS